MLRRRRQLVNQRVQERNWLERAWNQAVRASTQRHIEWLDQEIAALNQEYRDALESSEEPSRRADLYRSVPGIRELTAAVPVADLQKLGWSEGKGLCSLVGLAPWSKDSGRQRGYRTRLGAPGPAHGGPSGHPETRRTAPVLSGLRQRGRAGKVALVAVMRKLLLRLHAIARRGTHWILHPGQLSSIANPSTKP